MSAAGSESGSRSGSSVLGALFPLARPFLHALDAETAHAATLAALSVLPKLPPPRDDPRLRVEAFGLSFPNPVGLAAGFDKNAVAVDALLAQGFGFVEAGGVTPRPQGGNPRPRVFRLPEAGAVINRLGLNNEGMEAVAARLARRRERSGGEGGEARRGLVGLNLGANKDSADRPGDYALLVARFASLADFLTVNVSSPNTPGLRDLQGEAELDELLARAVEARDAARDAAARDAAAGGAAAGDATGGGTGRARTPLLLKIAPDLGEAALDAVVATARRRGVDGLVVSNTTIARPETLGPTGAEAGGLSGRPLFAPSTRMLAQVFERAEGAFPLIGVGGVDGPEAALAKLEAGASLVQLYTALVYEGPALVSRIKAGLLATLEAEGLGSLAPLVGRRAAALARGER